MRSVTSIMRQFDKDMKREQFRLRQRMLAFVAAFELVFFAVSDHWLFAALALLVIQTGVVEALRFRKAGHTHQTRRTIWRGSTPVDVRARPKLYGWKPWQAL